ncbi:phytanoyl-CoA dioxygenase family protein [Candidatus Peregrinibacteria bacterium]|nr:phytanoyl-CoA dioxygenase family protein [Candidatus Peregrinibacteria bacterium]
MALNEKQIGEYRTKGYLICKGLIAPERIQKVAESYRAVEMLDSGKSHPFFHYEPSLDDPSIQILRRIERVSDHSEAARSLIECEEILSAAKDLLEDEPVLLKDKLNLKLSGGAGYGAHIDGHWYWQDAEGNPRRGWAEYADNFLNVVLPLDPSKVENGCLEVAPLQETERVLGRDWETISSNLDKGGHIKKEDEGNFSFTPLETELGDVIFFDWCVAHRSGENHSMISRRILYATFNGISAGNNRDRYYEDRKTSQGSKEQKSLLVKL